MDKNWKLQRYNRKDYTELVEFPVEIVGRDGVVRRYTFEDSIRLYQRRITFAPIRYRDVELIKAEVQHCRSRIDQLRRSYFHRFGWGTPEGEPNAEEIFGELAGELAAFICRVLHCEGRPEIRFEQVRDEEQGVSTWYITPHDRASGMLLYVHRFQEPNADAVREHFFSALKSLERMGRCEGDGERLLAFHHTVDCGFVLSGRGSEFSTLVSSKEEASPSIDLTPSPWDELLEIIRRGEYEQALQRARRMVTAQPWHRNAYVAGAMLATYLGEPTSAEEFALVGTRYFPDDGALFYYLGSARLKAGRTPQAEDALRKAVEHGPELTAARTLLVVSLLRRRAYAEALALLSERRTDDADDRRGEAALERLEGWLRWRRTIFAVGGFLTLAGLLTTLLTWMGLVPAGLGLVSLFVGWFAFQRQVDSLVNRQRGEEISHGLRRLSRRRVPTQLVS